jgi:hypothetical protein
MPAELNRRIWCSRCQVGWWMTSARLVAHWSAQLTTDGVTMRSAAA